MSSPPFLPPELMASLNDEWLDPPQCKSPVQWSRTQHGDASDLPGVANLDNWHFPCCSPSILHRPCRELPLSELPGLSHTPFSCDSNLSGSASLSSDSLACYAPDLDALQSSQFCPSMSSCCPSDFSIPSFPCSDSIESTIHSPRPIFGYNTFEFDFDRPPSREAAVESSKVSRHKRHREDENAFDDAMSPKKRKMSGEAPGLLPLPSDLSEWNPCSSLDTPYPDTDVFSMKQLLDCSFSWGNEAWPNLSEHH